MEGSCTWQAVACEVELVKGRGSIYRVKEEREHRTQHSSIKEMRSHTHTRLHTNTHQEVNISIGEGIADRHALEVERQMSSSRSRLPGHDERCQHRDVEP